MFVIWVRRTHSYHLRHFGAATEAFFGLSSCVGHCFHHRRDIRDRQGRLCTPASTRYLHPDNRPNPLTLHNLARRPARLRKRLAASAFSYYRPTSRSLTQAKESGGLTLPRDQWSIGFKLGGGDPQGDPARICPNVRRFGIGGRQHTRWKGRRSFYAPSVGANRFLLRERESGNG
jgi:hypothetical protein